MKLLWICNASIPKIAKAIGADMPTGGGWIAGVADAFKTGGEHKLVLCFPYKDTSLFGEVDGITYYSYTKDDLSRYSKETEESFRNIIKKESPDVVHVWGTEFPHTLAAVNACERQGLLDRCVIHIQGLVSVYAEHYEAGLPHRVVKGYTLRDFLKRDNVTGQKKAFIRRGEFELEALRKARHVMGRTDWDEACAKAINPSVNYHFCNESLRNEFYDGAWQIDKCEKHSIFVSQASYPVKGFHKMLMAMSEIVKRYPDAHLYTTGQDLMKNGSFMAKQRSTYYFAYIRELIKKYKLEGHVTFLGRLDAEGMKQRYLSSHVFVSPSSIENSPNSLGEAMLLGVPSVSSDVGGVKNMMEHGKEGYAYPFDEAYMISHYVCKIFEDDLIAESLSANAKEHARVTHDREKNLEALLGIYEKIKED